MKRIAHLTSVHQRYDTRIYIKMCASLAKKKDCQVYLIVADGMGDEDKECVSIIDVGKSIGGRLNRMTKTVGRVYAKAVELDVEVYHLHDPELIPIGLRLKKRGKKIIFDAHEDLPKQILGKHYLNSFTKIVLSNIFILYEGYALKKFDAVVAATPYISKRLQSINNNTVNINNYPLLDELASFSDWSGRRNEVVYVGGITKIRGINELIKAISLTYQVRLNLVGEFSEKEVEKSIKKLEGWSKVNVLGFMNRREVNKILSRSKVGIVTFLPSPNHTDAQPNKMFEYMSAGIPVISSNFPLWKDIVEGNECGLCVDPLNPKDISEAIAFLITHSLEAKRMGNNGRRAVEEKYNWLIEEKKLNDLYQRI